MSFHNYVKEYLDNNHTLEDLQNEFGIRSKTYDTPDGSLVIFSYSHIDSPKTNNIVRMCRGLVLEKDTWEIVCYPFSRFYDYDEVTEERQNVDWDHAYATEKIDGTLLNVWQYKGTWYISTRSVIGGHHASSDEGVTFDQLFDEAIKPLTRNEFFNYLSKPFYGDVCYMFELVSPFNRVVTPYATTELYIIGARWTNGAPYQEMVYTNVYHSLSSEMHKVVNLPRLIPLRDITTDKFIGMENLLSLVNGGRPTDEGFVITDFTKWKPDTGSFPRIKLKGTAYKFLHELKGSLERNTPNYPRLLSIIWRGQQRDILATFPQFKDIFHEVELLWKGWLDELHNILISSVYAKYLTLYKEERILPQNRKEFFSIAQKEKKVFMSVLSTMYINSLDSVNDAIAHMCARRSEDAVFSDIWDYVSHKQTQIKQGEKK